MPLHGEAAVPTYRIGAQVPTGPGRTVHHAWHEVFKGPCVQKTVPVAGMPAALMMSEPELLNQLKHDHVVEIREAQFDPNDPTMVTFVMPEYAGGSIDSRLLSGTRFSVGQALKVCGDLLDALAYFHIEVGFLHCDVKPKNVLLDSTCRVGYLSDFGSAARLINGSVAYTGAGVTLPYIDPAAIPSGAMGVTSDIYAAGLTLFEALSGLLYPSLDPAKATVRLASGKRAYPDSALVYAPHVPDPVRRLVNRSIAVDPRRRFSSAPEMAAKIAAVGRRVIDWHDETGTGLDGEWLGNWPPNKPVRRRRMYRVQSRIVPRGRHAGERELEASFLADGSKWRRFGGLVTYVPAAEGKAVSRFFDTVDDAVAQNKAAR